MIFRSRYLFIEKNCTTKVIECVAYVNDNWYSHYFKRTRKYKISLQKLLLSIWYIQEPILNCMNTGKGGANTTHQGTAGDKKSAVAGSCRA